MSGIVSQSESERVYQRLVNVAKQLLDSYEEIKRLQSLSASLNLGANLDEQGAGELSKAEAIALFTGPLQDFEDFMDNLVVSADGVPESGDRRGKLDPFLLK
jgi:hypothetical protein